MDPFAYAPLISNWSRHQQNALNSFKINKEKATVKLEQVNKSYIKEEELRRELSFFLDEKHKQHIKPMSWEVPH